MNPPRPTAWAYGLVVLTALHGCGSREASGGPDASDVLTRVIDMDLGTPAMTFASDPESGVSLASVREAALLSDGGLVLIDRQSAHAVEYAPDGAVRRLLGRKGEGPGEFLAPGDLVVLPGDRVSIYDPRNGRLTTFVPGEAAPVVRSVRGPSTERPPREAWSLPDGATVTYEGNIRSSEVLKVGRDGSLVGPEAVVQWTGPAGEVEPLHSGTPANEMVLVGAMYLMAAFGRSTHVDVAGGVTAIALPTGFTVRVFEGKRLVTVGSLPAAASPLDGGEVDRLRDSLTALATELGAPSFTDEILDPELLPEMRPSFSEIVAGRDGRVVLREFAPLLRQANTWWVMEPGGHFMGRLRLPDDARIVEVGPGYLLAVRKDAFDVPRVELHHVAWADLGWD